VSAVAPAEDEAVPRPAPRLLARYAAGILWLGRYMERIENLARQIDVTRTFALDDVEGRIWRALLRVNADEPRFLERHREATATAVAHFYLLDRDNPTSIQTAMAAVRENARTLRALISTEMWLQINVFHARIRGLTEADIAPGEITRVCTMLKDGCQSHAGITEGTFYRDQSWSFYEIGRHLERADQTTRLLDMRFSALLPGGNAGREVVRDGPDAEVQAGQWNALLRAAAGYHAYRRVRPHGYSPRDVAAFLLIDTAFPRSVGLNLAQIEWHLTQLRTHHDLHGGRAAMERMDLLRALLHEQSVDSILKRGLSPFLDWLQQQIGGLYRDLETAFFPA